MAYILKMMESNLSPQRGEQAVLLFVRQSSTGYRGSANTVLADGRPSRLLARWVSSCPVALVQDMFQWMTSSGWPQQNIGVSPDSQFVPAEILSGPQPIQGIDWGADHFSVVNLMLSSLAPAPSAGGAAAAPQSAPQPTPQPAQGAARSPASAAPQQAPARAPADPPKPIKQPRLTPQGQKLAGFFVNAIRSLQQGDDPEEIMKELREFAGPDDDEGEGVEPEEDVEDGVADEDGLDGGDDEGEADSDEDELDEDELDEDELDEDELDEDELDEEELDGVLADDPDLDEPAPDAPAAGRDSDGATPMPTRLRPLRPGEIPPGITAEGLMTLNALSDPRAEEKMQRTIKRGVEAAERARRHSEAVRALEASTAQSVAPPVTQPAAPPVASEGAASLAQGKVQPYRAKMAAPQVIDPPEAIVAVENEVRYVSTATVAERLGRSEAVIRSWCRKGKIPGARTMKIEGDHTPRWVLPADWTP